MTRQQECIAELYGLLERIEDDARHHNLFMLRVRGGASGCDAFQGLPPISRIIADIEDRHGDVISEAIRMKPVWKLNE